MSDLRDLYQEMILDHGRRPRNFGRLEAASARAEGKNPLCGDEITLYVDLAGGVLRDVRFEGHGCAISTASASLMTESVKGKPEAQVMDLFDRFRGAVTSESSAPIDDEGLGKLAALAGVRQFPMRVKCASLAWHTLRAALEGADEPVTTE
jgi:nitrogen fixation NifU-like protein